MLPTKQMVLNVECNLSPVSVPTASGFEVLVGFVDYTVDDVKIARYIYLSHSHSLGNTGDFLNHHGVRNLAQYIPGSNATKIPSPFPIPQFLARK